MMTDKIQFTPQQQQEEEEEDDEQQLARDGNISPPNFHQLMRNPTFTPFFFEFLTTLNQIHVLNFWHEVEEYKKLVGRPIDLLARARKLIQQYLTTTPTPPFLSQHEINRIHARFQAQVPYIDLFSAAQREATLLLEHDLFPRFLTSTLFQTMLHDYSFIPSITKSIHDYWRDPIDTRTLKEYLTIHYPTETRTMQFVMVLRDTYAPLVAAALAPMSVDVTQKTRLQIRFTHARHLLDRARTLVDEFMHPDHVISMISLQTAEHVRNEFKRLRDSFSLIESTVTEFFQVKSLSGHAMAKQLDRIIVPAAVPAAYTTMTPAVSLHNPTAIEDLIRSLALLFFNANQEALTFLNDVVIAELERSDFHLPVVMVDDDKNDLLVWTLTSHHQRYMSETRFAHATATTTTTSTPNNQIHVVKLTAKKSTYLDEDASVDFTGSTVSCKSKGIMFRSHIQHISSLLPATPSTRTSTQEMIHIDKSAIFAGTSTSEAGVIRRVRKRFDTDFDPDTLTCTELHNYVFPLGLRVDVYDEPTIISEATFAHRGGTSHNDDDDDPVIHRHSFILPSPHPGMPCLYGTCVTRYVQHTMPCGGGGGGGGGSNSHTLPYTEFEIATPKAPGIGMGVSLGVSPDGCVMVSKPLAMTDSTTSPAKSKQVDALLGTELLAVNGVAVHGRRFVDDVVTQIAQSHSPVILRCCRGSFISADTITVRVPEAVAVLSTQPYDLRGMALEQDHNAVFLDAATVSYRDLDTSLFDLLSVDKVVDVLSALMLEQRVLLVSDNLEYLSAAYESLLFLLFPLTWQGEWCSVIPENHMDWFSSRVGATKPFFAGYCTVDLSCPVMEIPLKRQGRYVMRDEAWAMREKDKLLPSDRIAMPGFVKIGMLSLLQNTIVVDLDGDVIIGLRAAPQLQFPDCIRDELILAINKSLRRGGGIEGQVFGDDDDDDAPAATTQLLQHSIRHVMLTSYHTLLHQTHEFAVTIRANVMAFHRGPFLRHVPLPHHDWLEMFSKTKMFKEYVSCGWVLLLGGE